MASRLPKQMIKPLQMLRSMKIKPLTEFISQDPDELADFMEGKGSKLRRTFRKNNGLKRGRAEDRPRIKQYLTETEGAAERAGYLQRTV